MVKDKSGNKIAVIGAGHMGTAIIEGFINAGTSPKNIIAANPTSDKLETLKKRLGISVTRSNTKAAQFARFIFLTVKPTLILPVVQEIKPYLQGKILISAAALTPISLIKSHIADGEVPIIRIMPNLPTAVNEGIIGLYTGDKKKGGILNDVIDLISLLGLVVPVPNESDLDAITVLCGCGPAVIAYYMEILENTGKSILNDVDINTIIYKLFTGTLAYVNKHQISTSDLKRMVATRGGVTEALLHSLDLGGVPMKFSEAYKSVLSPKK